MAVIGHSQGGLLTKAMVVDSGDRFWANVSSKPIDEVQLSDQSRDLLRRAVFFHPLPITPGVTADSIISVEGTGPPQGRNDGVVAYDSAHIDGVASEVVVDSPHSCQANPHAIEEVRRILLEHLGGS